MVEVVGGRVVGAVLGGEGICGILGGSLLVVMFVLNQGGDGRWPW
ncbi:putative formin-like protein 20 [Iris pallida]|uniref:Formin-like protein 20 n=1 Tax=Iris pallida TaxID=29817 RepID=A0AAX6G3F4_IRIPA|nr:putative formin-like protein 20 [Iris pallida]KAJ6819449.1 putative formin-like protein 20 [Iris pallida]KAJ6822963.1 putative formin-like protein 20 [Iris pallida]